MLPVGVSETPTGARTPCSHQPMASHRLLPAWGTTPSLENASPPFAVALFAPRDPDAPSSAHRGTWLLPLPGCANAALCVSASDSTRQDTTVGHGTCLLLLARNHPWMVASHDCLDVFWAPSAGTPMSHPGGALEACTPSNHL